ncbi:hypothetical protein KI387_011359, partial [Taxus chinensis]
MVCAWEEKEHGKLVFLINDDADDDENILDFNHIESTHDVMNIVDEKEHAYHEPMKTKKVNIGTDTNPKEAII